jgi:signal transduction histidine kinase
MVRRPALARFTIRAVSVVGIGLPLAIWSFTGYRFAQHVAEVRSEAAAIDERYVRAQELLTEVRTQVLLGSIHLRDALIDRNPARRDDYRGLIQDAFRKADASLREYEPVLDSPGEFQEVSRLRDEITAFRDMLLGIMADESNWPADALPLLRGRVAPAREIVLDVGNQVQRLNRTAYVRQQAAVADLFAAAESQVWRQLGVALAISVGIGLLAFWRVGRLEVWLQDERAKDLELTRNLQSVSARLLHAQEEERRTVARELHDQLGQELTGLRLNLNSLKARSVDRVDLHEQIDTLDAIAQQLDRDVDFLVWELRPTALDDFGLQAALVRHAHNWSKLSGVTAEIHSTGLDGERLPADVETVLFRVAQEALNNIARHARASRVDVVLERRANQVALIVEDDGIGFDPSDEAALAERMGLSGMRERANLIGAAIHVESAPGKGTTIFVRAPLPPTVALT